MRRRVCLIIGACECVLALVVCYLATSLPRSTAVGATFDRVENAARASGKQVSATRRHVLLVRKSEAQTLAAKLQDQTEKVAVALRSQKVDFEAVAAMRTALIQSAKGLDSLLATLDGEQATRLANAFGESARFIDETLLPAAAKTAEQIEKTTANLSKDGETLARLLRETSPDLKAAREIHDSLARFDEGLDRMAKILEFKRLNAVKAGFGGLQTSLETTAGEVERLTKYHYPAIKVRGLKVEVEEKPFWPNGERIAEGLRKATDGVRAAEKEMDDITRELPAVRKAVEESRKVVVQTRSVLGKTLQQQDKLDAILRDLPGRMAALLESIPRISQEMAQVLKQTAHLGSVSIALKETQKGLDAVAKQWPAVRDGLRQTAELLRLSAGQLDHVVKNKDQYAAALDQSTELAETFARMTPLVAQQVTAQLEEQEASLGSLETSIDQAADTIPDMKASTLDVLLAGRILAWLVAIIFGMHGVLMLVENGPKNRRDELPA